jgi:hypothetical protein
VALRDSNGEQVSAESYKREVLDAVAETLDRELSRYAEVSGSVARASVLKFSARESGNGLVTPLDRLRSDELADLLVSGLPVIESGNKLADLVGPCYLTVGVQTVLGRRRGAPVSKQAVADRRSRGAILALNTADGLWVYPTWQFTGGEVRSEVITLLTIFGDSPRWSVAAWFRTPAGDLAGQTPLQWLDRGAPLADVERLARHSAARWAA